MSRQLLKNPGPVLAYLCHQLSEGTTLARVALERLKFNEGRLFAWLPASADQSAIETYLAEDEVPELRSKVEWPSFARFVKAFIAQANRALIVQDSYSENADANDDPQLIARYHGELYWRIEDPNLGEIDIQKLLRHPIMPYPWVGLFYARPQHRYARQLTELKLAETDLQEIVEATIGVAVTAFDNYSFVLWWDNRYPLPEVNSE